MKAFNDKIKISELFERNRLTQKVNEGNRRRNYNSDRYQPRKPNQTPNYVLQANAYFGSEAGVTPPVQSAPQDGSNLFNYRFSADNNIDMLSGFFVEDGNPTADGS